MSENVDKTNACAKCGTVTSTDVKFCPQCGHNLSKPVTAVKMRGWHFIALGCLTIGIWLAAWNTQKSLAGNRPTKTFVQEPKARHMGDIQEAELDNSEIKRLKAAAKAAPENKEAWHNLAAALVKELGSSENPRPQMIFDAIGALRKVLQIDPADTDALLIMANISFERQALSKAVELYKKYLDLKPDDIEVRVRYASALSALDANIEAIGNLKEALTLQPDHFRATAQLCITYSQMGEREQGLKTCEQALKLAPSEEMKQSFSKHLDSVMASIAADTAGDGVEEPS
ncbi:tetratricopeptide repeat protein [Oligoflexia bacterium]|nr:tetratricopeptide repeat protein [Oligoflexia bacterium]